MLPEGNVIPAKDILELIKTFASTWFSLQSYNEDKFPTKDFTKKKVKVQANELYEAVAEFKKKMI